MYESYTRQALPSKAYRELLGTALVVFNANNAFMIENILKQSDYQDYDWYQLIDLRSGELKKLLYVFSKSINAETVSSLFTELIKDRNRIVHSFQITDKDHEQRLATKDRDHHQFVITEEFLMNFIKKNEVLSFELYRIREGK